MLTPLAYMLASFPNTKDQEHRWESYLWLCHSPYDPDLGSTNLLLASLMFVILTYAHTSGLHAGVLPQHQGPGAQVGHHTLACVSFPLIQNWALQSCLFPALCL